MADAERRESGTDASVGGGGTGASNSGATAGAERRSSGDARGGADAPAAANASPAGAGAGSGGGGGGSGSGGSGGGSGGGGGGGGGGGVAKGTDAAEGRGGGGATFNFEVHGKRKKFAPVSLFCLSAKNPVRKRLVWLIEWRWFDRFILLLIVLNSIVLALSDYTNVDAEGIITAEGSARNEIVEETEPYFTAFFTAECVLKIVSMGFFMDKGSYLRDGWNILDFVVVVTGLLSTVPDMPNVSAFRTVRVLRPLRSLTVVPGMRLLVTSLLKSIPALMNVVALLLFVFAIFGILGVQIWGGLLHARCRTTQYPMEAVGGGLGDCDDPAGELCAMQDFDDASKWRVCSGIDVDTWNPDAKLQGEPSDCFWPVNANDTLVCSLAGGGAHECEPGNWCGSNYDIVGQPRFSGEKAMLMATFQRELNWGYTNFDNIFAALLTIFQMITMEGWTDVMYMIQDAHNSILAAVYFVFLILFGSFFLLNLTLAVIWDNFQDGSKEADEQKDEANRLAEEATRAEEAAAAAEAEAAGDTAVDVGDALAEGGDKKAGSDGADSTSEVPESAITKLVMSTGFGNFIIFLILLNTVVLAMDHHPMDPALGETLEFCNFVLTLLFTVEMVLKLWGMGPKEYARDAFNLFDWFIVMVSLVEMVVLPPTFFVSDDTSGGGGGGAISALRTFRLFRVFKLARSWRSLNVLLKTIVKTLNDVANFAVLLLLFMYIFALVGMQFFANRFCFNLSTGLPEQSLTPACVGAELPRAHFDDLLWAFVTIFQILTGENWNTVMYDGWRAGGWTSTLYFVALVVMGNFIVLNLFLAILLGNFEGMEELAASPDPADSGEPKPSMFQRAMSTFRKDNANSARVVPSDAIAGDAAREGEEAGGDGETKSSPSAPADADAGADASAEGAPKAGAGTSSRADVEAAAGEGDGGAADTGGEAAAPAAPAGAGASVAPEDGGKAGKAAGAAGGGESDSKAGGDAPYEERVKGDPTARAIGKALKHGTGRASGATPARGRSGRDGNWSDEEAEKPLHPPLKPLHGRALYIFGPTNWLRVFMSHVVRSSDPSKNYFDKFIMTLIIISSVLLAVDNPLQDPESDLAVFLGITDWVFTIVFTCEMVMKMITFGFVLQKDSYLRSGWNQLDFIIVIVSLLSLFSSGNSSLRSLRSLRTLRALRPLRVISRAPGLRLVVNALISSITAIVNVLFVCVLFFMIFGIVGVNYFKGTFLGCQGEVFESLLEEQVAMIETPVPFAELNATQQGWVAGTGWETAAPPITSKMACGYFGADWDAYIPQNFDNIISAMGTLFEMSTTEGWVDIMYAGVDATGIDSQPVRDIGFGWVFFFMAFMVVGSFFVMNLFVGVVIDNFNTMKERLGDSVLLTESQKEWVKTQELMLKIRPLKRTREIEGGRLRKACHRLVVNNLLFDSLIMGCIVGNTVVMALTYFGEPPGYTFAIEIVNYVFAGIFTIEAVLKLIALHKAYFHDGWNVFDFVIVVGTLVGLILKEAAGIDVGSIATVVRTFRVGRVFRLVKSAKSLRQLFQTLLLTLPGLGNIGGLLFLMFFIYAVMGVQLYAKVTLREFLNVHANFQDFWPAVLTLMRSSTGESWNYIMYDMAEDDRDAPGGCDPDLDDKPWFPTKANMCGFSNVPGCTPITGCGSASAFPFFISFTLFVTFVFLNLFIAVILEGFGESSEEESMRLSEAHFRQFAQRWTEFDPDATLFITTAQLFELMQTLEEPMGFGEEYVASKEELQKRIAQLNLTIYHDARAGDSGANKVHFKDVSQALARRKFEEDSEGFQELPEAHKINKEWRKKFPAARSGNAPASKGYDYAQFFAAQKLQRTYHAYRFRTSIDERIQEKERADRDMARARPRP